MKKASAIFMIIILLTFLSLPESSRVHSASNNEVIQANDLIFSSTSHSGYDLSSELTMNNLWNMNEGSIAVRFTPSTTTTIQSLFSISNSSTSTPNTHFQIYITNNKIGFEIRNQTGGDYEKKSVRVPLVSNREHALVLTADHVNGYRIYLDGKLVLDHGPDDWTNTRGYGFFNVITNANSAKIGLTERNGANANKYPFSGTIKKFKLYNTVLSSEEAIAFTQPSSANPISSSLLFDEEDWNSPAFRIPSLLTTSSGTTLAVADIRYGDSNDSPNNIDIGIRRSFDGGNTWTDPKLILNFLDYPNAPTSQLTNSASLIDTVMVEGNNGRIFLFVDAFKGGVGQANSINSSGYTTVGNNKYLTLVDSLGNKYYKNDMNRVVNAATSAITNYTVNDQFELLNNGNVIGHIFYKTSPLTVEATSFVMMIYSDDEGATWSNPKIMNDSIKTEDMKFLGVSPGIGIQLTYGDHAGRLLVPVYYTSTRNTTEYSAVMYSDDNGGSWTLGESPNDGRIGGSQKLHESQLVEMPDGQVKMFARTLGKTAIATSFDGGMTWDDEVELSSILLMSTSSGCQLSIINYSGFINGKPALIFSNPAATTRSNGTIRVGVIEENGTYSSSDPNKNNRIIYSFDWIASKVIRTGEFAYSSLTELPNGNIGILFEENNTRFTLDHLVYEEYTLSTLMQQ